MERLHTNVVEVNSFHCTLLDLNDQMRKFWELENVSVSNNFSIEEKLCEENYSRNVSRSDSGRYSVDLPIKPNISNLSDSSFQALRQFYSLEQRLSRNEELKNQYSLFMKEYSDLNHMELVENPHQNNSEFGKSYYMPHHAVIRDSSTTTKVRVVFNASSPSSSGISLNDCMMNGPTIQQDLFSIVARFRKHKIAFSGDITKMYRQIEVHDKHRDLQRIWWRDNINEDVKCYRLCTVTYGTTSAPYLAIKTLHQLASDECTNYPETSVILKRDFYVDDVLTGAECEEKAMFLKTNLTELLQKGGFELRKFESNSSKISDNDLSVENIIKPISILGIRWNPKSDTFFIHFPHYDSTSKTTKRSVLSEIAQLFDPLGLISPMVFIAKLFMQSIWNKKDLQWDDELPQDMIDYWQSFKTEIENTPGIDVPRCVIPSSDAKVIDLHGFADASEVGYGCAIYIRVKDSNDNTFVNLLCAKSRVSPLKRQTIPRLELCAALLLAQLMKKILEIIDVQFNYVYYWSDSEITLYRLKSTPSRYTTFVANRISQIQELSDPKLWFYVPTDKNPADLVSRGVMPSKLMESKMWYSGPEFLLMDASDWPQNPCNSINNDLLELRKQKVLISTQGTSWEIFDKYSDYKTLLRVTAWMRRFIKNCKCKDRRKRVFGELTVLELDESLKVLVRNVQNVEFATDISYIKRHKSISPKSKLLKLSPFLDGNEVLRVGGRLKHANISYDQKHQMILPKSHKFAKLIVRYEHLNNLHAGVHSLNYILRLRFWILNSRNLCKEVVRECMLCFRYRARTMEQIMGQLPDKRITPARAFSIVGVDFCGPFYITHNLRSKVTTKSYVALFICFVTKAVHMEVVTDLSTKLFISALRRFVARRGLPSHIYSDNATNFVGAKAELQDLHKLFTSEFHQHEIQQHCISEGIQWHTIPPRSPHFGGIWEAAIKSAKYHLKRLIGKFKLTNEHLETLCAQTEAILNSRPISPMSDDPNDLTSLTPGHFLIGTPLVSLPDPRLAHLNFNRLDMYQKVQYFHQELWTRWSSEYISELQERTKWKTQRENIKVGSLVLIKEDNTPPLRWNLGRVLEVHRGSDGFVRVVTLKTENNIIKRAIARVCLLPVSDNCHLDIDYENNEII